MTAATREARLERIARLQAHDALWLTDHTTVAESFTCEAQFDLHELKLRERVASYYEEPAPDRFDSVAWEVLVFGVALAFGTWVAWLALN